MLRARAGDADGVALLERVVPDQTGRNLAGDAHDRDRIHERVGEPRHRVGRARARGHQHAADLAGRAGVAFGGVHRALLVAHQDVLELLLLEHLVIDRQDRAARIAENVPHALIDEGLDHHLGAAHLLCHYLLRSLELCEPLRIKKGLQEPLSRAPPRIAGGLATPGGAPSYDEDQKIAHGCALLLRFGRLIRTRPYESQATTGCNALVTMPAASAGATQAKSGNWWRNHVNCRLV